MAQEKWTGLYDLQQEQGWSDSTLLGLILTFITNNGDREDLMAELSMRAETEKQDLRDYIQDISED